MSAFPVLSVAWALVALAGWIFVRQRRFRENLRAHFGLPEGAPLVVERHGRTLHFSYRPGGKNTPPTVRVTTNVDEIDAIDESRHPWRTPSPARDHVEVRPAIVLRRETAIDRFGKRLGLNRELEVGDPVFDAAVYIETDSPEGDVKRTLAADRL